MPKVKPTGFRAVRKTRISEQIITQIHGLVTSGRLRPGDRLPAERELTEALRGLESQGVTRSGRARSPT